MDFQSTDLGLEAMLHAIARDEQQALAVIRRFLDAGGSPYALMFEDELKPFHDNPEYQEMAAKAEARNLGSKMAVSQYPRPGRPQ